MTDAIDRARQVWEQSKEALEKAKVAVLEAPGDKLKAAQERFLDAYHHEKAAKDLYEGLLKTIQVDDLASGEFSLPFTSPPRDG